MLAFVAFLVALPVPLDAFPLEEPVGDAPVDLAAIPLEGPLDAIGPTWLAVEETPLGAGPDASVAGGETPPGLPDAGPVGAPSISGPSVAFVLPCVVGVYDRALCPDNMLRAPLPGAGVDPPVDAPTLPGGLPDIPVAGWLPPIPSIDDLLPPPASRPTLPAAPETLPDAAPAEPAETSALDTSATQGSIPDDGASWIVPAAAAGLPLLALTKLLSFLALRRRQASPVRQAILGAVAAEPGVHHTDLVRRLAVSNGTVAHHLRRLVDSGLLTRVRTAGHTCYFLPDAVPEDVANVRVAARAPATRHVLNTLAQGPCTLSLLAQRTGLPVSTLHYHVGKLERAGAIVSQRRHGRRRLALSDAGARSLGGGASAPPPKPASG